MNNGMMTIIRTIAITQSTMKMIRSRSHEPSLDPEDEDEDPELEYEDDELWDPALPP